MRRYIPASSGTHGQPILVSDVLFDPAQAHYLHAKLHTGVRTRLKIQQSSGYAYIFLLFAFGIAPISVDINVSIAPSKCAFPETLHPQ